MPRRAGPRDQPASGPANLPFHAGAEVSGLRVGYFPAWMKESPATDVDRAALDTVKKLGMTPIEVSLPNWPYDSLNLILFSEAAAAFEELTLSHKVDQLKAQVPDAWPNVFRQSRFLSAVDFVQADRFRRKVAVEMARIFSEVDFLLVPFSVTRFGHQQLHGYPSLTFSASFFKVSRRSDWKPDPSTPAETAPPAVRKEVRQPRSPFSRMQFGAGRHGAGTRAQRRRRTSARLLISVSQAVISGEGPAVAFEMSDVRKNVKKAG
jgi:hypothetical protein